MYTARSHGVKVLRTFLIDSGGTMTGMDDSAVRAKMTQNALSLSSIPPSGRYNSTSGSLNPPFDGLFFDLECKAQPCPWLTLEESGGIARWLGEVKAAWPGVFLSLYVEGNPDCRITALPSYEGASSRSTAHSMKWAFSAAQVVAMEPHLDQVMFAGFGGVDAGFLQSNTLVPCTTDGSLSNWRCSGNNSHWRDCHFAEIPSPFHHY